LEDQGITTALDLKRADQKAIRRKMTVVGERLVYELNGRPCLPLELMVPPRQGLTVSCSFRQTLTTLQPIKDALVSFVGRGEAQAPAADGGAGDGMRHDELVFDAPALLRQRRDGEAALPDRLHARLGRCARSFVARAIRRIGGNCRSCGSEAGDTSLCAGRYRS
jgi:hypothetical protein